jgi:hypothetical protein
MWVAVLRFVPADDLTHVLDQGFALGDVLQGEHAFAMHP